VRYPGPRKEEFEGTEKIKGIEGLIVEEHGEGIEGLWVLLYKDIIMRGLV